MDSNSDQSLAKQLVYHSDKCSLNRDHLSNIETASMLK